MKETEQGVATPLYSERPQRAFDKIFIKRLVACVGSFSVATSLIGVFLIDRASDRADETLATFNRNSQQMLVDGKAIMCSTGSGLIINFDNVTMSSLRDKVGVVGDNTGALAEALAVDTTTTTTPPRNETYEPLNNPLVDENGTDTIPPQVSNPEFEKPCPPIMTPTTTTTTQPHEVGGETDTAADTMPTATISATVPPQE